MHDALNELSQRGAPRGFDQVFAAASESADRGADADDEDLGAIPLVNTEPTARPRRRPMGSMIAAAGVAALVLVGAFAVSAMVGSGGGSGSPEGAVQRLADALSHEDPLAAADVLAPDEVRSLHGTVDSVEHKAAELKLVQTAGAPLTGVDFNVSGLKLSSQALGDGYAKVTIDAGQFSASTHHDKFSPLMQQVLRNSKDNSSEADLAKLASDRNLPTFVMVVRESGRWYVSAAYTVLEYIREYNQLPAADYGSGNRSASTLGADSPDAAVQDAMRALQAQDWSKLMTLAPPNEIPVYDYRAALTALIQKNSDGPGSSKPSFTITSMSTKSQLDGDTAKVTLDASGTTDSGKWSLQGGCFTPPDNGDQTISAFPCGDARLFLGLLASPMTALDPSSAITAVRQDGRWFVSPVGTVLDVLDHFVSSISQREAFSFLGIPNQIPPDGRLTLGQPVALTPGTLDGMRVLTFDGHKGEQLIALATSKATTPSDFAAPAFIRGYGPDGAQLYAAAGILEGQPLVLPADGTYTFVFESVLYRGTDAVDVTVWDAADAPAAAKKRPNGQGTCTYTSDGEMCTSATVAAPSGIIGSSESTAPTIAPFQCPPGGGQSLVGPNREMIGADGKPQLNPDGTPVTWPPGFDTSTIKLCGQNGGGSFGSSGSSSATTVAVAPHG